MCHASPRVSCADSRRLQTRSGALKKVLPKALVKREEPPPQRIFNEREPDISALLKPVFGDGLLGRTAGALFGAGLQAVAGQVRSAAAASAQVQDEAAALVESDPRVVAALGGPVRCGPPFAVSSSRAVRTASSPVHGGSRSSRRSSVRALLAALTAEYHAEARRSVPTSVGGRPHSAGAVRSCAT